MLHAWREWTKTVPDEVTSVGRILQIPPIAEVPPSSCAARTSSIVEAVVIGDRGVRRRGCCAPLRALGPEIDTFAMVPPVGIAELHMDPPTPAARTPAAATAAVRARRAEVIDDFVAATGPGSGSPLVSAEIRHIGGELARGQAGNGALATLPGEYMTFGVGLVVDAAIAQARARHAGDDGGGARAGRHRPPLPQLHRGATDPARSSMPARYARLRAVKAASTRTG